jgi:two-component system LytT family response regulator
MRALVVDDELPARRGLIALLEATGRFAEIAAAANAVEALAAIRDAPPDVLFLDVQMPKISGLELLGMIDRQRMPYVVFVTAHDEYAVKAFDENAVDYLLKPVPPERLAVALDKLERAMGEERRPAYRGAPIERVPCQSGTAIRLVDLAEVELVRSSAAGVYVVTARGEFFTDLTLQVLEEKTDLMRCHRQYLVNLRHVEQILRPEPRSAVLQTRSGKEVPTSRRYLGRLKARLGL